MALCFLSCSRSTEPPEAPDPARIAAHLRFLSSDELEGRGPGTRSETLTLEYLADQFARAGAAPAGDEGSYFQSVPLVGVEPLSDTEISWRSSGAHDRLENLTEVVAVNHQQLPETSFEADAVYVGHGIVAAEFDWDDYKDVDVSGKIVLLFTNEPPSDDPSFFGGKALTYYGRWSFKYEEALRRGALGVLIVHTDPTAGYPWEVVRNSWGRRNPFVKLEPGEEALTAAGWITAAAAEPLLQLSPETRGKSVEEILELAHSKDFRPIPLKLKIRARLRSRVTDLDTRNVVAKIEGSDARLRSEAVLFTAHWDHLGAGAPRDGDSIYNGAVDNASGCAVVLELARLFGRLDPPPKRTILFAAVTAEEGGLRGSEFYASHPAIPTGRTAANLNFDGILPLPETRDVSLPGYERTTLAPLVESLADEFGFSIRPDPHPEQGYYYTGAHK